MYKKNSRKLCILAVIHLLLFGACSNQFWTFQNGHEKFNIENQCVQLNDTTSNTIAFNGSIWYDEYEFPPFNGEFGLHSIDNDNNIKLIPINPFGIYLPSPTRDAFIFQGYMASETFKDTHNYSVRDGKHQKMQINQIKGANLIWDGFDNILGTSWDTEKRTITVITTDLTTGTVQENTVRDSSMSTEPAPKIASNGVLTYIWYQNYEGPRLVVYDTKTNIEIARYKDILYQIRPSWYGYLLNPQGTHILSISSLSGEGYDGWQQELFGVEIGKEPVQITNFHSIYPYTLIYDINFGGQNWSPNNRWIILNVLTSETKQIDSSINPSWLFLIDLEKNIGYQICQQINPKDQHSITWSPDNKYFALSINDKIWVIDPITLYSRLLVEKAGIPLQVLGWTIP